MHVSADGTRSIRDERAGANVYASDRWWTFLRRSSLVARRDSQTKVWLPIGRTFVEGRYGVRLLY